MRNKGNLHFPWNPQDPITCRNFHTLTALKAYVFEVSGGKEDIQTAGHLAIQKEDACLALLEDHY